MKWVCHCRITLWIKGRSEYHCSPLHTLWGRLVRITKQREKVTLSRRHGAGRHQSGNTNICFMCLTTIKGISRWKCLGASVSMVNVHHLRLMQRQTGHLLHSPSRLLFQLLLHKAEDLGKLLLSTRKTAWDCRDMKPKWGRLRSWTDKLSCDCISQNVADYMTLGECMTMHI